LTSLSFPPFHMYKKLREHLHLSPFKRPQLEASYLEVRSRFVGDLMGVARSRLGVPFRVSVLLDRPEEGKRRGVNISQMRFSQAGLARQSLRNVY
jgi:hypothetical protein